MTIAEQQPIIAGRALHRLILSPDDQTTIQGGLIFFHGQGDFIDRYPPLLKPFVRAGYQCILTDLPGHGRSPGTRGDVPSITLVNELLQSSLAQLTGPIILTGHSMGGLLALHYLLKFPERFSAAWVSSPLLDPMRQAQPWMRRVLPFVSKIFPWLTLSTGVRSEDCGDFAEDSARHAQEIKPLYHSRISLGWGRTLRDTADQVRAQFQNLHPDIPILFTQGSSDPICPAEILSERLQKLPENQITYQEIPDALHEPFSGSRQEEFLNLLDHWIKQGVEASRPRKLS